MQKVELTLGFRTSLANPTVVHHRKSRTTFPPFNLFTLKKSQQGARYNIQNEVVIGALLLPGGLGSARESTHYPFHLLGYWRTTHVLIVGAPIAGRMSDRVVVRWREKRNGCLVPEDRLRAALPGALILLPLSVLLSGVFTHYVSGTLGLVLNMGCLFVSGIGVRTALHLQVVKNFFPLINRRSRLMWF
jgi:hypothetical protein